MQTPLSEILAETSKPGFQETTLHQELAIVRDYGREQTLLMFATASPRNIPHKTNNNTAFHKIYPWLSNKKKKKAIKTMCNSVIW